MLRFPPPHKKVRSSVALGDLLEIVTICNEVLHDIVDV